MATARPELLERRPGWGGGKLNATTLALSPLSDDQTAELIAGLLARPLLAAESQQSLLERAGGNPLYAEQFVELYTERGSTDELPLPETLQGIIAARLDGLPDVGEGSAAGRSCRRQGLLGRALDGDTGCSDHAPLARAQGFRPPPATLVTRRLRASSRSPTRSFATSRTGRSRAPIARRSTAAVAEWIDGLGRPEDHAEMLAYHWGSALELVRASGGGDDELVGAHSAGAARRRRPRVLAQQLRGRGGPVRRLRSLFGRTTPSGPTLLFRLALALHLSYDRARQQEALEAARDALLAVGDTDRASEAEAFLARVFWDRGEHDLVDEHLARAEALAGDSVSPAAARVSGLRCPDPTDRWRARRRTTHRRGRLRDGDRARARRATRPCAHDDRHGEERRRRRVGHRRHGARARDRLAADSPIACSDRQQPRRLRDVCRRLSAHGRALRRGARDSASGTETPRASASSAATASGSTSCSDAGTERSSRRMRSSPNARRVRRIRWSAGARGTGGALDSPAGTATRALRDQLHAIELAQTRSTTRSSSSARSPSRRRSTPSSVRSDDARALAVQVPPLVREVGLHGALTRLAPFADELGIGDELRDAVAATSRADVPCSGGA